MCIVIPILPEKNQRWERLYNLCEFTQLGGSRSGVAGAGKQKALLFWKPTLLHLLDCLYKHDISRLGLHSNTRHIYLLQKCFGGLPWWCSGWESAFQCRGHGFKPWSGKIPHAAEQLGPWATITEPVRLGLCSATGEAAIVRGTARAPRWRVAPACHN